MVSRHTDLLAELPILQRLALAYAPAGAREPTLALLALDTRLAAILRAAREPMLAQLRLAWWREQLKVDPSAWPHGEPLLAVLRNWKDRRDVLIALVDGWEAMTAEAPLPASALESLARARGDAFAALADMLGVGGDREAARNLATDWAMGDLAVHLSNPEERGTAGDLARARPWRRTRLSRGLRPLIVLHGLAARAVRRPGADDARSLATLFAAVRLGLLGR
jgi:phytoene synthase